MISADAAGQGISDFDLTSTVNEGVMQRIQRISYSARDPKRSDRFQDEGSTF
jgi:hypothetical protein